MRDRLYIGTMENVLSSSTKILVDTTKGNNFLYLPLDKLSATKETEKMVDEEDLAAQAAAAIAQTIPSQSALSSAAPSKGAAHARPVRDDSAMFNRPRGDRS